MLRSTRRRCIRAMSTTPATYRGPDGRADHRVDMDANWSAVYEVTLDCGELSHNQLPLVQPFDASSWFRRRRRVRRLSDARSSRRLVPAVETSVCPNRPSLTVVVRRVRTCRATRTWCCIKCNMPPRVRRQEVTDEDDSAVAQRGQNQRSCAHCPNSDNRLLQRQFRYRSYCPSRCVSRQFAPSGGV